jgi:hypothetical protein
MHTDILTGQPKTFDINQKRQREEKVLEAQIDKGMEAEAKINTEQGKYFVGLVLEKLEARINILVQNDSEATTLVNMVRSLNYQVDIGHAAAERLLMLRREKVK